MVKKNDDVIEVDLLQLLKALWRRGLLLGFAMLLGGVLAGAGTLLFLPPTYKASVLMYVNSTDSSLGGAKGSISQGELSAAKSLIDTYTVILQARTTLDEVAAVCGISYAHEELSKMISAESVNNTEVFQIHAESSDPVEAMNLANTIAQVLPEKIASIVEGSSARIVDMAVLPTKTSSPNYLRNTVTGALLGLVLSAIAVIILEVTDDKIHDSEYLSQTCGLPVLAVIPDLWNNRDNAYTRKPIKTSGKEAP